MQSCSQFCVLLGGQCIRLSKGNVSDQVLYCIIANKSVEKNKTLVQNCSEKTSENFALCKLRSNGKSVQIHCTVIGCEGVNWIALVQCTSQCC